MTCIVGVIHDGTIYMGGDSAASDATTHEIRVVADPKVFINDQMLIGCCSSMRVTQLMRYALIPPDKPERKDDMSYLVTDFMDAVRNVMRDKGSIKKENEVETHDAHFLIGYNERLYYVEDDFQIYKTFDNFAAIGSGADIALGALYATKHIELAPERRIMMALEAAETYNMTVRRPFYVEKL